MARTRARDPRIGLILESALAVDARMEANDGNGGQGGQGGDGSGTQTGQGQEGGQGGQGGANGGQGGNGTQTGSQTGQGGQEGQGGQGGTGSDWTMDQLPEGARNYITQLRNESAEHRTGRQTAEQGKTTAEETLAQLQKLLSGDKGEGQAPDPEKLAADLKARDDALAQERAENLAYRRASANGADPDRLLNSRQFVTALHALEAGDGHEGRVDEAIKAAVKADAQLAPTRTSTRSGGEVTPGAGGSGPRQPTSIGAAMRQHYSQ